MSEPKIRADTTPLASGVGGLRSGLIRLVGCRVLPSALTLAFLGTDASPAPPQLQPFSDPIFAEVSARVGLAFKHVGGNLPLNHAAETMGSGGGFLDFDNDGWIDVYLVNGGLRPGTQPGRRASNRLFRNNGDGSFTDVTKKAGVGDSSYGMGCAFADYNNDGLVDIYVTNLGPNLLYRNNGDGTFTNVTPEAGVGDPRWSTSAAFGDYDRDGHLDLYVCNYLKVPFSAAKVIICPYSFPGVPNTLYRNQGDGTFQDVTSVARVREDPRYSKSLGVLWLDIDNDDDPDLYVANDTTANHLFENRGEGSFDDISILSGTSFGGTGIAQAGMGVDAAGLDGSARFSIVVTNYSLQSNNLYWNEAPGSFSDRIVELGLAGPGFLALGFGANFLDYDNNGLPDLFVANGHVLPNTQQIDPNTEYEQTNQLFRFDGSRFVDVSGQAGAYFKRRNVSRGSATGDFNNDGRVDLLITNNNGKADLLENLTEPRDHWLKIQLRGTHCNRDAVGAKATMTSGSYSQTQEVRAGTSYLSQSDLRLNFGLGIRPRVDSILVSWPCGKKQQVAPPQQVDQIIEIREEP